MAKQKKSVRLRLAAWLMAVMMLAGALPTGAFAAADEEAAEQPDEAPLVNVITDTASLEEAEPETPADEPDDPAQEDEPAVPDEPSEPEEPAEEPEEPADEPSEDTPEEPETDPSGEPSPETDGDAETFTVSYYSGAELLSRETVESGALPKEIPSVVASSGRPIAAWTDESGAVVAVAETPVEADVSYYAWLVPALESQEHIRYISGQGEGLFCPTDSLTRAQAATILSTLLDTDTTGPVSAEFSDVKSTAWYYEYISLLASYGIVNGYEDGTFRPNNLVTRAEFITMLVNVTGVTGVGSGFTDIASHWAREYIEAASRQGWISGYEEADGTFTFRPQRYISRAEAVTVVNRVVGRSADERALSDGGSVMVFLDVSPTAWYYAEVMEACIEHDYTRSEAGEEWKNYKIEGVGMTPGLHEADGRWFLIDGDGLPVYMKAGVNEFEGKFYYAPSAGCYFTGDLSKKAGYCVFFDGTEQALADEFNLINNSTLFYWDKSTASARKLTAGLNEINGTTYWADEDGYVIRNDFGRGVATLGGEKYLSGGYCDIITTGLAYKTAASKPTKMDLKEQTYEFDDKMYYIKSDYTLACDEWITHLYFGEDCAYTSGDATIDSAVWSIIKGFVNNTALTKEQKLLKAYYYIRGGEGSTYAASPYKYRMIADEGYARGRYNGQRVYSWIQASAKRMYTQKAGMCYEWAAAYLYVARRLGFDAYIVVGSVFAESTRHCWCMIKWDGSWHISDVEIEWGYLAGWYSNQAVYRNLFSQTVSKENFSTYSNPECSLTYWVWEE